MQSTGALGDALELFEAVVAVDPINEIARKGITTVRRRMLATCQHWCVTACVGCANRWRQHSLRLHR